MHQRLVVMADQPAKLTADARERPSLPRRDHHQTIMPPTTFNSDCPRMFNEDG
jgi:hypothetical protein